MANPLFLGIEGGGTRTVALLADAAGTLLQRHEAGPANLQLLTDRELQAHFRALAKNFPRPAALGIGLAGARTEADRGRIRAAAASGWPRIPCYATNDLETALAAGGTDVPTTAARILVLSGTGSCCYGRNARGQTAKAGGWGHILGDHGSGYAIALRALQAVLVQYDHTGKWPRLGQRLLRTLLLNEPDQLIRWAQAAGKTEVAALAPEVCAAAQQRDPLAREILQRAAGHLARDAAACARQLKLPPAAARAQIHFILAGSNLVRQPQFANLVRQHLQATWPRAVIAPLERESAWGAVALAKSVLTTPGDRVGLKPEIKKEGSIFRDTGLSPTELRNPRSMNLDRLPVAQAVDLMLSEDAKIPAALRAERAKITRTVQLIVRAFRRGGRLFYVGAGTSGRLGVLDASECPPTFRTPPEQVQGIIAGGQTALWQAAEGAEDDAAAGGRAMEFRGVSRRDVVVGIAASGRTPFVWGALAAARARGAKTVLVCFNPALHVARRHRPDVVIAPQIGPEVLTGSTRLKAGTATKLILNLFTTLSLVQMGKVVENLMVDLNPSNVKLRDRAVRIVRELKHVDAATARHALEASGWVVAQALKKI
ncbi:MAG TPA: N-acetylmuramic acid 6-phosphate etherase [Dongiaceae bacterium]|nr:N-acetylmuramic acid 6-phosphate etherase [Dongiaceae bacterium]